MGWQVAVTVLYFVLFKSLILYGVTGDRHLGVHASLIFITPLTLFSFNWDDLDAVAGEGWAIVAVFTIQQIVHTSIHYAYPTLAHREGPEILTQPALAIWATAIARSSPDAMW